MSNALAEQQGGMPAPAFDADLIRRMYAKDCTNDEFRIFCQLAKNYGLDPSMHQIWAVKYGDNPASFIVGRDGLLEFAHRSGFFDGMESGTTGDKSKGDLAGWAKVYRTDMTHPFCVTVDYLEYVATDRDGKPTRFWAGKPKTMITKVAEAQALRKAFRMSGLYCEDEMPSASEPRVIPDTSAPVEDPKGNPNKCVNCQTDVDPEHIEKILEHTGGVPMCNRCFSDWYRKQCEEKEKQIAQAQEAKAAKKAEAKPAPKPAPKPEPKTVCQTCGKEIAPGTTHCQACIEKEMQVEVPPKEEPVKEPEPVADGPVCQHCGKALSEKEVMVCQKLLGGALCCAGCLSKIQRGEIEA